MTAQVLAPIAITDAMIVASSVAEPDTTRGELPWSPTTNYAIGNRVIRSTTHRVYTALAAGVDAGLPEATPSRWTSDAINPPTNKWAGFDMYRSTPIQSSSTLTMTVKPGIITGMQFFGLVGDALRVVCKDAVSLAVYFDTTYSLSHYLTGDLMWEFYYGNPRQQDSLRINNLTPQNAQVEITLTVSPTTGVAAIGTWALGSFQNVGLPQYGWKASPVDYTRIAVDAYGNTVAIKGLAAKNISGECLLPSLAEAQAVADVVYRVLGTPCAWVIADAVTGYDYLSAFGFGSADITASGPTWAKLNLTVRGLI